jgi:hypothetical protein
MSDYIRYLKMAKGDAPDPLHAAILELLRQHAPRDASGDSGGGPNDPPPPPGGGG